MLAMLICVARIQARTAMLEAQHRHMVRICLHCGGGGGPGDGVRYLCVCAWDFELVCRRFSV